MDLDNRLRLITIKRYAFSIIVSIIIGIDIFIFIWGISHNIIASFIALTITISIVFMMCFLRLVKALLILTILSLFMVVYAINTLLIINLLLIFIHAILLFIILRMQYYTNVRDLLRKNLPIQVIEEDISKPIHRRSFAAAFSVLLLSGLILFMICYVIYNFVYKWILLTSFTILFITTIPFTMLLIYMFQRFLKHVVNEVMGILNLISARKDREYMDRIRSYMIEVAHIRNSIGYVGGIELVTLKTVTSILAIGIPLIFYYPFAYKLMSMINPYHGLLVVDLPLTLLVDLVISLPMIHGFRTLFEKILSRNISLRAINIPMFLILSGFVAWFVMYILLGVQQVIWIG